MRRFLSLILIVLLVLIVVAQGAILAIYFLGPRTALDQPSDTLTFITALGTNLLIPDEAKTRLNPQASNPDAVSSIQRVYQSRCEVCHGVDGKGQSATGSRMLPRAGDLTSTRSQSMSDGSLFWIIGNGLPHTGMPGWKDVLKEDEMWQLVDYVRALPKGILTVNPTVPPTVAAANPTAPPTVAVANPTALPTVAAANPTAPLILSTTNPTGVATFAALNPAASRTPTATSASIRATNTITISIQNYAYYDDSYNNVTTVPVGTRVVWIAADDDAHTASSETTPRTINSPTLLKGETYEVIFTQPGEYPYFCVPHPSMKGVVIVK